ncbi:MAG: polyprenyl synthetase family protein [Hydrogenothermaceae bacterium]|nr:polyprenyl synthetase family protein [Hydrogenothermaceae bacterium]
MIFDYLKKQRELIDRYIKELLPKGKPDILFEAIEYTLSSGGKRIRPILLLESARAVNPDIEGENIKEILVAIEFVHTYSLVHDDLPAMDDDDFRRGKLTCHKVYGEAMAVLVGDGLLTHAFHLISSNRYLSPEDLIKVIRIISEKTGLYGMIAGQAGDILPDFEDVNFIHQHKTAKFMEACCEIGGIVGGGDGQVQDALKNYGFSIGMAFQIWDDILDEVGDEPKLGKKVRKDKDKNKTTFPKLYDVEVSKKKAFEYVEAAVELLKIIENRDILAQIAKFIVEREV